MTWRDQAACLGMDAELWFPVPETEKAIERAKKVCRRCPVTAECLMAALLDRDQWGIWGGLTEGERRELKRRARRTAVAS